MFISDKENPEDPNFDPLKMLSFAYQPLFGERPVKHVYGIIMEFRSDPFSSERKFLTCYDSGFSAYYSTHHGGNINGKDFPDHNEITQLASFEHFISSTTEIFPNPAIAKRSKHLLKSASEYLDYTSPVVHPGSQEEVQIWFLTHSGVLSARAHIFEIKNKSSVWAKFFKDAVSICKDLEFFGRKGGTMPKAVSF
jgi:hypothetical protein